MSVRDNAFEHINYALQAENKAQDFAINGLYGAAKNALLSGQLNAILAVAFATLALSE